VPKSINCCNFACRTITSEKHSNLQQNEKIHQARLHCRAPHRVKNTGYGLPVIGYRKKRKAIKEKKQKKIKKRKKGGGGKEYSMPLNPQRLFR